MYTSGYCLKHLYYSQFHFMDNFLAIVFNRLIIINLSIYDVLLNSLLFIPYVCMQARILAISLCKMTMLQ